MCILYRKGRDDIIFVLALKEKLCSLWDDEGRLDAQRKPLGLFLFAETISLTDLNRLAKSLENRVWNIRDWFDYPKNYTLSGRSEQQNQDGKRQVFGFTDRKDVTLKMLALSKIQRFFHSFVRRVINVFRDNIISRLVFTKPLRLLEWKTLYASVPFRIMLFEESRAKYVQKTSRKHENTNFPQVSLRRLSEQTS